MAINVLCVDDDASIRRGLQNYLHSWMIPDVDLAENYTSALKKVSEKRYDIIILDGLQKDPDGDCFKLYQEIERLPHGDIFIFSSNLAVETEAKKRGIPFCMKPDMEYLDTIISKYNTTTE